MACCRRPVVSGSPMMRFKFCKAWPDAPFTRLSKTAPQKSNYSLAIHNECSSKVGSANWMTPYKTSLFCELQAFNMSCYWQLWGCLKGLMGDCTWDNDCSTRQPVLKDRDKIIVAASDMPGVWDLPLCQDMHKRLFLVESLPSKARASTAFICQQLCQTTVLQKISKSHSGCLIISL